MKQAKTYIKVIEKEETAEADQLAIITDVENLHDRLVAKFGAVLPEERQWMRKLWAKAAQKQLARSEYQQSLKTLMNFHDTVRGRW